MAAKKQSARKRPSLNKKQFRIPNAFRAALEPLFETVFGAEYVSDGTDDEIRSALEDNDDSETEADVIDGLDNAVGQLSEVIKTIETQLTAAKKLREQMVDSHNRQLIVNEWREGMVECPRCSHVFKGEDYTL